MTDPNAPGPKQTDSKEKPQQPPKQNPRPEPYDIITHGENSRQEYREYIIKKRDIE